MNVSTEAAPPPQAPPAALGDFTEAAAYDRDALNIALAIGAGTLFFLMVRSDVDRGFWSGKGKGVSTAELVTRLVAIGGIYYFWRQQTGQPL